MRPGRSPERDHKFFLAPQIGRKSVRPANDKCSVGDRLVTPMAQMTGKSCAVNIMTALVQRHKDGLLRYGRRNRRGLLGHSGGRLARAALGNLDDVEAAESQLAADNIEPRAVAFRQLAFRPLLQTADRNYDEAHGSRYHARRPIRTCRCPNGARLAACSKGAEDLRSLLPPSDPASTISRDCRTHAPRV